MFEPSNNTNHSYENFVTNAVTWVGGRGKKKKNKSDDERSEDDIEQDLDETHEILEGRAGDNDHKHTVTVWTNSNQQVRAK